MKSREIRDTGNPGQIYFSVEPRGKRSSLREGPMTFRLVAKSLLVWLGILALAIANGALREAVLIPQLGQLAGLVVSGVLLASLIVAVSYVALPWLRATQASQLMAIGLGWLVLTLIFEFSFGMLQGKSWPVLLAAYTFTGGNIWPLVLLVTACAPWLAAKLRGWR